MGGQSQQTSSTLNTSIMSISIVIVITAVVLLEKLFHLLHFLTKDTAFSTMILRIENELMIVGSTAFIFRLIVTPYSNSDWVDSLTYADLIVPIFSFCYCGIGIMLIISSLQQCNLWRKSYYLQLIELLDEFLEKSNSLIFRISWKPLNQIITKIEFRVFHALFCDFFFLKPDAFAFDEYVARVYEKYVFSIISINMFHWSTFIALVLLNWARVALKIEYQSCSEEDIQCKEENGIVIFTSGGAVLFAVTAILVFVSRNFELKIMAKRNITSYKSYNSFLKLAEEGGETVQQFGEKLDENALREIVEKAVIKALAEQTESDNIFGKEAFNQFYYISLTNAFYLPALLLLQWFVEMRMYLSRLLVYMYHTFNSHQLKRSLDEVRMRFGSIDDNDPVGSFVHLRNRPANRPRTDSNEEYYTLPTFLTGSKVHGRSAVYNEGPEEVGPSESNDLEDAPQDFGARRESGRGRSSGIQVSDANRLHTAPGEARAPPPLIENNSNVKLPGGRRRSLAMLVKTASRRISLQTVVMQLKGEHIKDIFWLSKPELYFETVRFFIMLIALYFTIWLVEYSNAMVDSGWKFLAILPGILSAINYLYVVKTAALLKAMYTIDFEAADIVFRQTDGARLLERTIREKLTKKMQETTSKKKVSNDLKTQAFELFSEIDYDNSGVLDRREFSIYLSRLGIPLNRKQWHTIFRKIDIDASESISFQEFFVFLYPEHKESIRFERHRLNTIHMRVDTHINLLKKSKSKVLNGLAEDDEVEDKNPPSRQLAGAVSSSALTTSANTNNTVGAKHSPVENCKDTEGDVSFLSRNGAASTAPLATTRNIPLNPSEVVGRSRRSSSSSSSSSSPSSGDEQCGIHPMNDDEAKPDSE